MAGPVQRAAEEARVIPGSRLVPTIKDVLREFSRQRLLVPYSATMTTKQGDIFVSKKGQLLLLQSAAIGSYVFIDMLQPGSSEITVQDLKGYSKLDITSAFNNRMREFDRELKVPAKQRVRNAYSEMADGFLRMAVHNKIIRPKPGYRRYGSGFSLADGSKGQQDAVRHEA